MKTNLFFPIFRDPYFFNFREPHIEESQQCNRIPLILFQIEQALEDQFVTGRVLAAISSRPGQCGRADGYILEGKELEFYLRKIKAKKGR